MKNRQVYACLLGCLALTTLGLFGCNGGNGGDKDGGDGGQTCTAACDYYYDCADTQDCIEGCCQSARVCSNPTTCQPEGLCVDGRCVHLCSVDTDCPENDHCMHGFCESFPQEVYEALTAAPPDEDWTEKQPLKVGIGDVPLDFPVGVSMAGFGARLGSRNPYRDSLGGSDSMLDRPRVKAFAFDNGLKRLIIIKMPLCYVNDFTVAHTAWRVHQETGENYLDRMVFSGTHSHSHPARFWNLLPGKGMGVLAYGDFSFEIFQRITKSTSQAVLQAIEDLQPARFGYAYLDPADPEEKIHRNRRGEWPIEYDDVLLVMRIDDDQGNLRAVLINLGLHGTHFEEDMNISGDAPGAVEVIAQDRLQEEHGLPVKVAFLSRNTGDSQPVGDGSGLDDFRKVQEVGIQAWYKVKQLVDQLEGDTTADLDMDMATIRVPLSHQALGYAEDEFYDIRGNTSCEDNSDCMGGYSCIKGMCGSLYYFGGFQCVWESDEDPATMHEDGAMNCIFSVAMLWDGRPVPQFGKSRLTILHLGDLGLVTLPGEPVSDYSRNIAQMMKDSGGFAYASILGLSQSHHLYLMHQDNWLQGGYEPSMDVWGWREGDYYVEKISEMIEQFAASGGYTDNAGLKPTWFDFSCQSDSDCGLDPQGDPMECHPEGFCVVAVTPTSDPGTIVTDIPAQVERMDLTSLVYVGGHPGVDLPRLVLEREDAGNWVEATNAAGEVYSDDGFNTRLWYRGDYKTDHTWEVNWEESISYSTGRYRLRVEGHYFDGSATQAYTVHSSGFDYVANNRLIIQDVEFEADRVSANVFYPSAPTNDDGSSAFEQLKPAGHLHHTGICAPQFPWPLPIDGSATAAVTIQPPAGDPIELGGLAVDQSGQTEYSYVSARDDQGAESTASTTLPSSGFESSHAAYGDPGSYSVTIRVTDQHGNTGSGVFEFQMQ